MLQSLAVPSPGKPGPRLSVIEKRETFLGELLICSRHLLLRQRS